MGKPIAKHIPLDVIENCIQRVLKKEATITEIGREVGVCYQTVQYWMRRHTTSEENIRYSTMIKANKQPVIDPRDAEIARLKAALEKAELRARALDTMIDVAEENFKIKIRKKAGAKQ